jgi:mannose-6-phosphate isomerase-like protein (cupin superfamily)
MKLVRKDQTTKYKNSKTCIATEYPMDDKDINIAIIELDGRYPKEGRVVNNKCKELSYIVKGSGKIIVENKEIFLEEGDAILVEPEEKYYWDGKMTLLVPCTPAWYPEQHQNIAQFST